MSRDTSYGEKYVSDLEHSNSGIEEPKADANGLAIEELGAGAASKNSGILGKVNSPSFCVA